MTMRNQDMARGWSEGRQVRVLLAEDDNELRRLVARALERRGHQVVCAADGTELLEALGRSVLGAGTIDYDVIVSDVRMPGWSGLDMLAGLRAARVTRPVVLVTAFGTPELHQKAQRLGARAVLDKPFDLDELCTVVKRLTATHRRTDGDLAAW